MFVLIHGGGHSARCWEPLVPLLDAPARALDLPGRGAHPGPRDAFHLDDWIESAARDIEAEDLSDIVLVGHSMAGLSMPGIIDRVRERLRHVVFVSCAVPTHGGTLLELLPPDIAAIATEAPATPDGIALPPDAVRLMQCYDMDEAQTAFTLEVVVPECYWPSRDVVSLDGLEHEIGKTWIRLERDQTFPPAQQNEMARRAGCTTTVSVDSGHMAMISHPQALAAALNGIHDAR